MYKRQISVRGGLKRSAFKETSEALFLNSGYVYDTAEEAAEAFSGDIDRFVYSRFGNPTVAMLEERLALMEGAEAALATGTGMASMFMSMAGMLSQGDRVVASRALFGACYSVIRDILPRWGVLRWLLLMAPTSINGPPRWASLPKSFLWKHRQTRCLSWWILRL